MPCLHGHIVATIAVFDSGLGSLSIIEQVQQVTGVDIVYLADQASYPYGTKSVSELDGIIRGTIADLRERINPDIIVVGSNTPSVMLDGILGGNVVGVLPPLAKAQELSRTKSIAVLSSRLVAQSSRLEELIWSELDRTTRCARIDAQEMIEMVESGEFVRDPGGCAIRIRNMLADTFEKENIDTVTLSSTHLPFLTRILSAIFRNVTFLDPAYSVAEAVIYKVSGTGGGLRIYATGDPDILQKKLEMLGIPGQVSAW